MSSNTSSGSSTLLATEQQSSNFSSIPKVSTLNKWSQSVSLKKILNIPSTKLAKRRKVGVENAFNSNRAKSKVLQMFQTNKTLAPNECKENGATASKIHQLNADPTISKKTFIPDNNAEDKIATNYTEVDSPNYIKINGFLSKNSSFVINTNVLNGHQPKDLSSESSEQSLTIKKKPSKQRYQLSRRNSSEQFTHLGLLAPAFILHPTIHHEHILTKKLSKTLGKDLHLKLAAAHIKDAINGHGKFGEARAIFKPSYIQKCFKTISSSWWTILLYTTIVTHSIMIFFEQPATPVSVGQKWLSWQVHPVIPTIDALCLIVYMIDIVLHVLFFTWRNIIFSKEAVWLRVEIVFTCLFMIDYGIFLAEIFTSMRLVCPFRCLRAYMLLCKSKNVSHIFNVLLSIISKLGKVLLIIAIFLVTFASVGLHIFMNDYHNLIINCSTVQTAKNCTNIYDGAFDNVANAALHMFVLMSTENYPEFIIPAFRKSWANFFYFGLFLYFGVFFLTAILLAIIVESYWDYSKRHVKHERRQQREELAIAWNIIDPLGNGQISVNDKSLLKLFQILKPKNTYEENLELISYISTGDDGLIDSYDWTTRLVDALSFEFEEEPFESNHHYHEAFSNSFFCACQTLCRHIMHANAVSVTILVLILIHSILFCLMWTGISKAAQLGIQSTRTSIVGLFCLEVILRIIADGKELLNIFDVLDMIMVFCAAVADIAWYILWFSNVQEQSVYLGGCVVASGLAVLIRAVFNSKHARTAVRILQNIIPVMLDLILLVTTIIFSFSVIGFELFQDKTLNNTIERGYEGSYVEYGCNVGFDTFACSLLIVFQIVTTNDWQEIMLGAMLDAGSPFYALYFVACYLIVDMIVMNLFVAISIEAYKKLAVDNTSLPSNADDTNQEKSSEISQKPDSSFTTTARSALEEIFATSRKSKANVNSATLTGYASSPYAVRRGTLGSLGLRTPTPSPRPGDRKANVNPPNTSAPIVRIQEDKPPSKTPSPPSEELKQRSVERRQRELRERQRRKRATRKTKADDVEDTQFHSNLQIEDVVHLKRMVRVIKSFHARNLSEMDVKEGDLVQVTGNQRDNMLLGPKGWFPAANVTETAEEPKSTQGSLLSVQTSVSSGREKSQHRVQFDVAVVEPKPHRISQTRMVKRTDGADWRRDIHGDITVMNKDEMQDLSRLIRGGLERRHTSRLRNTPSQFSLGFRDDIREEDEEESSVPKLTVSEVPELKQEEDKNMEVSNDTKTDTLTLSVPQPHPRHVTKKKSKPSGDGQMPEWMQKFVSERQINLDEDVKFVESSPSTPSSADELRPKVEAAKVTVHERKRKRALSPKKS